MVVEDKALWNQMLRCKYGVGGVSWVPTAPESSSVSRVWADVLYIGAHCPGLVDHYLSNFKLVVGNGKRVQFWEDKWLNNLCLKEEFPRLYSLSVEKGCTIQQMYQRRGSI